MSISLYVYEGVYVYEPTPNREGSDLCESKIGLAEAKLKGKNYTSFSVSF